MRNFGRHGIRVAMILTVIWAVAIAAGCGEPKTIDDRVNEAFRPFADEVPGSTYFFEKPGTLIFTFSGAWNDREPGEQSTFLEDVGTTWAETAEQARIPEADVVVLFENDQGEQFATYKAGKVRKK